MNKFTAQILPEHSPPDCLTEQQRRELQSHSNSRLVWGEGNPSAPIFVILDNPGARENKQGEPYICGTRETLQKAVFEAGLDIQSIYVTYLLKSRPIKKYDKEVARQISLKYLLNQIAERNPRVVFCLGNVVVQSYFGNAEATVKGLRGHCYAINNIKTFVSYHPLAVRRRPVLYKYFLEDWSLVASQLG